MTVTLTETADHMTDVARIPKLSHREAMQTAANEYARTLEMLHQLRPDDWQRQTVCPLWNVQVMVAHMLGMAEAQALFASPCMTFARRAIATGGAMIDAMTATQVRDRANLSPAALVEGFVAAVPRAVRARRRVPPLVRSAVRMRQDPPFDAERWPYGYLVDTVFTRDPWMHRLDISRAIDRDMGPDAQQHDARLIAEVVAEWAGRHGAPFSLVLTGPAGGHWMAGQGGEHIEIDALDFCWTLAGRLPGTGLLGTPVPF